MKKLNDALTMIHTKVYKKIALYLSIVLFISFLVLSKTPIVQPVKSSNPTQVKEAKDTVKKILGQFSSNQTFINVELTQSEINALMSVASHTFPNVNFNANLSPLGLSLAFTKNINLGVGDVHLNFLCILTSGFEHFEIEGCKLGSIPIAGWLIKAMVELSTSLIFGEDVQNTIIELLEGAKIEGSSIKLSSTKSFDFKAEVKSTLKDAVSIVRMLNNDNNIDNDVVTVYLNALAASNQNQNSLAYYVQELFQLAEHRSIDNDPIDENTAALWALAITYGNRSFARFIGITPTITYKKANKVTLRGRTDLRLHFLYSVFLEQVGKSEVGLKIGELKELLDTNKGGSGFSFADLAADKAGLFFAQRLTSSTENAIIGQTVLANGHTESNFFPFIHDLPEGFKENEFTRVFHSVSSEYYKSLELDIDKRIEKLALHRLADKKTMREQLPSIHTKSPDNKWLIVDTHIHSKFSDGKYEIKTIAEKAANYGCDAIAITDHGDINLNNVTSNTYFDNIELASAYYPNLTIIPALEWNIPPFMGREHATVLLPKHANTQRDLTAFRNKFDSWGRRDKQLLSAEKALQWLDKYAVNNGNKPVVIYNHPNRKGSQTAEIKHNFQLWSSFNNIFIGFSGAPGHQKKRGSNNGSYEYKLKTKHGWDPSVASTGGEWDQLIQQGYNVWAARAPSDFHNLKMDYWPCQFSTTHLYAKSKGQNDILKAFQRGSFWGQHGKYVDSLNFNVITEQTNASMGENVSVTFGENVEVSLKIQLAKKDWQGFQTTLDEVELIIITPNNVKSIKKLPKVNPITGEAVFNVNYRIMDSSVAFRWRGRSIQPEKHHYMFYTNPIRLTTQQH